MRRPSTVGFYDGTQRYDGHEEICRALKQAVCHQFSTAFAYITLSRSEVIPDEIAIRFPIEESSSGSRKTDGVKKTRVTDRSTRSLGDWRIEDYFRPFTS